MAVALILIVIFFVGLLLFFRLYEPLPYLVKGVEAGLPVPQIDPHGLALLLETESANAPLIFDVRTEDEYAMSHLQGAIRADKSMSEKKFIAVFGGQLQDRDLIFYCAVGYASSRFIQKVGNACQQQGARAVKNLRGGIFTWYNEERPLFNLLGYTNDVHPYGKMWRFLLRK